MNWVASLALLLVGLQAIAAYWYGRRISFDDDRVRAQAESLWERRGFAFWSDPSLEREMWIREDMQRQRRSWRRTTGPLFLIIGGVLVGVGLGGLIFG